MGLEIKSYLKEQLQKFADLLSANIEVVLYRHKSSDFDYLL